MLPTRPAAQADWSDDERILGVVVAGQARAYPVAILNWHELVNDTLGGEPILVGYVGHPDWLRRAHAAWALGEFDTGLSRAALEVALDDEHDGRVRREINEAKAPRHADPGLR